METYISNNMIERERERESGKRHIDYIMTYIHFIEPYYNVVNL
jgi:hypothetical protein